MSRTMTHNQRTWALRQNGLKKGQLAHVTDNMEREVFEGLLDDMIEMGVESIAEYARELIIEKHFENHGEENA